MREREKVDRQKQIISQWTETIAQLIECLPSVHEVLHSDFCTG